MKSPLFYKTTEGDLISLDCLASVSFRVFDSKQDHYIIRICRIDKNGGESYLVGKFDYELIREFIEKHINIVNVTP